jgi:hypothetical protein
MCFALSCALNNQTQQLLQHPAAGPSGVPLLLQLQLWRLLLLALLYTSMERNCGGQSYDYPLLPHIYLLKRSSPARMSSSW